MKQTLWNLSKSHQATVTDISDELDQKLIQRLQELGLSQGQQVKCLRHSPFNGPRVYQLSDSVFSLDKDLANFVQVETQG